MQTNSPQADTVNPSVQSEALKNNQFHINDVPAESGLLVGDAAVFNVAGHFCATQAKCPHKQGPLNEGKLDGSTRPLHIFSKPTPAVPIGSAGTQLRSLVTTSRGEQR